MHLAAPLLALALPAQAGKHAPVQAEFAPVQRGAGTMVKVGSITRGEHTFAVRCALTADPKLACELANKKGTLRDSHITRFEKTDTAVRATIKGMTGTGEVTGTVVFKNTPRDIKEKLSYVALDYEEEMEK
jgi:hypothetical protein